MHPVQLVPSLIITLWINMTQVSPRKLTSCQDILYYLKIRCARKKSNQKQEQNLLSKVFNLFEIFEIAEQEFLLDSLLSAWTFVYWNMNTRWKYFLNYYHRIFFLEIEITTVQRGVVFTGVELREKIMFLTSKFRWYKNVNFRYHQLIYHLLYF